MRSFQQVVLFLFALVACVFAQEGEAYDATVYVTSTIYRVNTVTMSSSAVGSPAANQTSTISASHPTVYPTYSASNTTTILPTGVAPSGSQVNPSQAQITPFEGAASSLNVNAFVVALVAGVAYLVL
ncbi:hypothetical protein EJ02DRAFT_422814 [Clathrospora elynae]|uniref:Uncharacterized protein n=1 Tax=Clathrospora elynae TaxID=706981 RepID=A0A6A5SQ61_9PLEO|nr:hypothetical protein EJ02DRAFT_422814 [Clathrospora elynae]